MIKVMIKVTIKVMINHMLSKPCSQFAWCGAGVLGRISGKPGFLLIELSIDLPIVLPIELPIELPELLNSWCGLPIGRAGLVLAWGKTGLGSGQQSWKQINKCWLYTFCNTHCYYYSLLDWFPIGSCWPQLALLAPIVVMLFSATERICENWSCSHSSTRWKS